MTVECLRGGSIPWMAPEFLEADSMMPTAATDIWAYGMTILVCPPDPHLLPTVYLDLFRSSLLVQRLFTPAQV